MAIGLVLDRETLNLIQDRELHLTAQCVDENNNPIDWPAGTLQFVLETSPDPTIWEFTLTADVGYLNKTGDEANAVPRHTKWQLVFTPEGDTDGGQPLGYGWVGKQAEWQASDE